MGVKARLPLSLLMLRISVFLVMLMWTLDKFVRPEHASAVYEHFYFIGGLGNAVFYIIGGIELVILLGFLLGYQKRITYGVVLVLHAISTISSYKQYLSPYTEVNLLFFAAFPMLAACFALYYLRDADILFTLDK
jgi:uncharacterized membrane protein YkgB